MTPAASKIKRWREDPVTFVTECLRAEPDPWQVDVLRAFGTNQRIAMKAAKGCGKSTILAWLAWCFLATRPYPKVTATSISSDNLSSGLWPEMSKWQNRSEFLKAAFEWQKTRIICRDAPEQWFMAARAWPKSADSGQQADTLAGLHADYLLFILDEVGGIPDSVMAAAEAGLATGIETKIVIAGNPTHTTGPLYRAVTTERHLWWLAEITGDPDNPKRASRIDIQWARDQISKYGATNPFVLVNVFGQFPPSSLNALLGPDEVSAAMSRHLTEDQYSFAQKRIGVDVARFGDDATVIFPRQGLAVFQPVEMRNARTNEIAARIALAQSRFSAEQILIDDTGGWGAGVIDSLLQAGINPLPVNFSGRATDPRYFNKRSEIHFELSEFVKRGGALPNIPELARELTAPQYTFFNGKLRVEEKDQIKARLGHSSDYSDALALTFNTPDQPAALPFGLQRPTEKLLHEYDPFESQ